MSNVSSTSKSTNPSTMQRAAPARPPSCAYCHAASTSSRALTTLWPFPLDDMIGLITAGSPSSPIAVRSSSAEDTNR